MVISSLVVETTPGKLKEVSEALKEFEGVEVHNEEGYKIVITIEAESIDASYEIATAISQIPKVTAVNLIYANFEDDPGLQQSWERLGLGEMKEVTDDSDNTEDADDAEDADDDSDEADAEDQD